MLNSPIHRWFTHGQNPNDDMVWTPEAVQVFQASRNMQAKTQCYDQTDHRCFDSSCWWNALTVTSWPMGTRGILHQEPSEGSDLLQCLQQRAAGTPSGHQALLLLPKIATFTTYIDQKPLLAISGSGNFWSPW